MIQNIGKTIFIFCLLVILQVLVLNNLNLFGYINPLLYVLFLIVFPFYKNQSLFIVLGFLLGLSIDLLSQSGGAHTIACLTMSFFRPFFIRVIFGINVGRNDMVLDEMSIDKVIVYVIFMVFIHHLVFFSTVYFNSGALLLIFKNTLFTALASIALLWVVMGLFKLR